jgi:hypothetical protein
MVYQVKVERLFMAAVAAAWHRSQNDAVDVVVAVATGPFLSHLQRLAVLVLRCAGFSRQSPSISHQSNAKTITLRPS